jgi:hypothetical protein
MTASKDVLPHQGHGSTFLFTSESVGEGKSPIALLLPFEDQH